LIKNLLVVVLAGSATLSVLVVTAFVMLTGRWVPTAVLLCYAVAILFVFWRSRTRTGTATGALGVLRRWTTLAFAISVLGLIVAFAATLVSAIRPKQATLVSRFHEHRTEYEALREMVVADGLYGVSDCGRSMARDIVKEQTPAELGIASERQARYESLLRSAGCPGVGASDGSVRFNLASWGMANNGWRIGLHWSKTPPQPLVPTIDSFAKRGGRSHSDTEYSRIDGDWYLSIVW